MAYTVIKRFRDLQDGDHVYEVGDTFPREGAAASAARLKELSTDANRRNTPLIKEVKKQTKQDRK